MSATNTSQDAIRLLYIMLLYSAGCYGVISLVLLQLSYTESDEHEIIVCVRVI